MADGPEPIVKNCTDWGGDDVSCYFYLDYDDVTFNHLVVASATICGTILLYMLIIWVRMYRESSLVRTLPRTLCLSRHRMATKMYANILEESARALVPESAWKAAIPAETLGDLGWGAPGSRVDRTHFKTSIRTSYRVITQEIVDLGLLPSLGLCLGSETGVPAVAGASSGVDLFAVRRASSFEAMAGMGTGFGSTTSSRSLLGRAMSTMGGRVGLEARGRRRQTPSTSRSSALPSGISGLPLHRGGNNDNNNDNSDSSTTRIYHGGGETKSSSGMNAVTLESKTVSVASNGDALLLDHELATNPRLGTDTSVGNNSNNNTNDNNSKRENGCGAADGGEEGGVGSGSTNLFLLTRDLDTGRTKKTRIRSVRRLFQILQARLPSMAAEPELCAEYLKLYHTARYSALERTVTAAHYATFLDVLCRIMNILQSSSPLRAGQHQGVGGGSVSGVKSKGIGGGCGGGGGLRLGVRQLADEIEGAGGEAGSCHSEVVPIIANPLTSTLLPRARKVAASEGIILYNTTSQGGEGGEGGGGGGGTHSTPPRPD